jgi:hypothetical protein
LERDGGALLFRTKENITSRLVKIFPDGSRLIDVDVPHPKTRRPAGLDPAGEENHPRPNESLMALE